MVHGFLRAKDGAITRFDAPGAGGDIVCASISPAGAITGFYRDANGNAHGFLRKPDHHKHPENELGHDDREDSEHPD